jgi:hypothetical protein
MQRAQRQGNLVGWFLSMKVQPHQLPKGVHGMRRRLLVYDHPFRARTNTNLTALPRGGRVGGLD